MTACRNCGKELNTGDSFCRDCGQVVFADENLEAAVREELEKPEEPLTKNHIRELTELDASAGEIEHLSGLDSAVNLTELNVDLNEISDVSPLASLTNLTSLIWL
jgi:internalin A